jgi:hypothetical protein
MAKRRLLPEDPRWPEFCARYQGDIVRFAHEVCGYELSRQQRRLLVSVARSRSRTSVASGHGTGKTKALSVVVLWHLLCHPLAVMLVTANDMDQLKASLWKEVDATLEKIRQGPFGWIAAHVFVGADAHCHIEGYKSQWFCESKTANAKTANKMAGRHGKWFMIVCDEASTIPDEVMTTLSGALTEKHNRMLLTSQFTRNAGYFWRTQTELSEEQGGDWTAMTFSSFDSPWVSDESLMELWESYDDDERRVRLLGLPPEDSSKHMMSLKHAHALYKRGRIIGDDEPYGWFVLGDIASGEGLRDKSAVPIARVIGYGDIGPNARRVEVVRIPLMTNKIRSNVFANYMREAGADLSNATYVVDSGGLGINVCQDLEDAGVVVHRVNWGNPCFQKKNQDRYLNLRAQAMHQAARAAKEGRLSVLTEEHKRTLIGQASRIPKTFTDKGRIKVPPKGSTEWEGLGSPDLFDAICFAFLENAAYIVADGETRGDHRERAADKLKAAADDAFSDLAA